MKHLYLKNEYFVKEKKNKKDFNDKMIIGNLFYLCPFQQSNQSFKVNLLLDGY
jgi:hypothetical protein